MQFIEGQYANYGQVTDYLNTKDICVYIDQPAFMPKIYLNDELIGTIGGIDKSWEEIKSATSPNVQYVNYFSYDIEQGHEDRVLSFYVWKSINGVVSPDSKENAYYSGTGVLTSIDIRNFTVSFYRVGDRIETRIVAYRQTINDILTQLSGYDVEIKIQIEDHRIAPVYTYDNTVKSDGEFDFEDRLHPGYYYTNKTFVDSSITRQRILGSDTFVTDDVQNRFGFMIIDDRYIVSKCYENVTRFEGNRLPSEFKSEISGGDDLSVEIRTRPSDVSAGDSLWMIISGLTVSGDEIKSRMDAIHNHRLQFNFTENSDDILDWVVVTVSGYRSFLVPIKNSDIVEGDNPKITVELPINASTITYLNTLLRRDDYFKGEYLSAGWQNLATGDKYLENHNRMVRTTMTNIGKDRYIYIYESTGTHITVHRLTSPKVYIVPNIEDNVVSGGTIRIIGKWNTEDADSAGCPHLTIDDGSYLQITLGKEAN